MIKTQVMDVVQKAMDGSAFRHTAITNNIANVNTPGYKKLEVSFQDALSEALEQNQLELKKNSPKHLALKMSLDDPQLVQTRTNTQTTLRTDGNNVDVDIELAALAENNLYFNSLAQLLSSQISLLRQSITEGKR